MGSALKVINWVMIVIVLIASLAMSDGVSSPENIFMFVGGSIWLLPCVLALVALRPTAGTRSRVVALIGNALSIVGLVAIGLDGIERGEAQYFVLGVFLLSLPAIANLWGLHKLRKMTLPGLCRADVVPVEPRAPDVAIGVTTESDVPQAESAMTIPTAPSDSRNYIVRHWRGELSLPVSYWVNGSLLGVVLAFVVWLAGLVLQSATLRVTALVSIVLLAFVVAWTIWSLVGIWRSATNHPSLGGSVGWANIAKIMVLIGMVGFAGSWNDTLWPQFREYGLIAVGSDPFERIDATISGNGRALILKGYFGEGSAAHVRELLNAAPAVETIMLESAGGRLKEAEEVAALVLDRGLDTYVESHCESACTYVFLAGVDRAATPYARIGFHSPTMPGSDAVTQRQGLLSMQAHYRRAGISQSFLDRISETPSHEMWYPERSLLVENGVINRLSTGGEVATLSDLVRSRDELTGMLESDLLFAAYERHFPGLIDQAVEATLNAHARGATDAELMSATRAVLADYVPNLLAAADGEQLRAFLEFFVAQLTAAKGVSDDACDQFLESRLNIAATLPANLIEREREWTLDVLEGPLTPRPAVSEVKLAAAFESFVDDISPHHLEVVMNLPAYAGEPILRCDASIAFYRALLIQPEPRRTIVLSGMFQAE